MRPSPVSFRHWRLFWAVVLIGLLVGGCGLRKEEVRGLRLARGESIQEAIARAEPGETILLPSGTWVENLRIQKSVVLKGAGPKATTLKAAQPGLPVIWVLGDAEVVIEDLTVSEGRGGYRSAALSSAGIFAQEGAVVTLRRVQVGENAASGVFARDSARIVLEDCTVTANDRYGLELLGQARVAVRGSQISQNKGGGIWLSGESSLDAEDTEITTNLGHGIWARDRSLVRLFASELAENEKSGLYLQDKSSAHLLGSRIAAHQEAGVYLADEAELSAHGTAWEGNWVGLEIVGGKAYLEGCSFQSSRWDAIEAQAGRLEMINSRLTTGRGAGLSATGTAQASVRNCEISGFSVAGIVGFSVFPIEGEGNELRENGVDLLGNVNPRARSPRAQPQFASLRLDREGGDLQEVVDSLLPGGVLELGPGWYTAGIVVDKPLQIRGHGAILQGKPEAPVISVVSAGKLELFGLHITGGSEGLALAADAQAALKNCYFWENGVGIKLWHSAKLEAQQISVSYHAQGGLWLWDQSQAQLVAATFYANEMCGIGVADQSRLVLRNSTVMENGWQGGLLLRGRAQVELYENSFVNNRGYGISVQDRSCLGSGPGFFGLVQGSGNLFEGNYKGPSCPGELAIKLGG